MMMQKASRGRYERPLVWPDTCRYHCHFAVLMFCSLFNVVPLFGACADTAPRGGISNVIVPVMVPGVRVMHRFLSARCLNIPLNVSQYVFFLLLSFFLSVECVDVDVQFTAAARAARSIQSNRPVATWQQSVHPAKHSVPPHSITSTICTYNHCFVSHDMPIAIKRLLVFKCNCLCVCFMCACVFVPKFLYSVPSVPDAVMVHISVFSPRRQPNSACASFITVKM